MALTLARRSGEELGCIRAILARLMFFLKYEFTDSSCKACPVLDASCHAAKFFNLNFPTSSVL